jgi:hypothetical protein
LELDGKAELGEACDQAIDFNLGRSAIEIVGAEVLVLGAIFDDVPWSSPPTTQHLLSGWHYPLPKLEFHQLECISFGWRTTRLPWDCPAYFIDIGEAEP